MSKRSRPVVGNLGEIRIRHGLRTQADLAEALGSVDTTFVTRWESGRVGPNLKLIRAQMASSHPGFVADVEAAVKASVAQSQVARSEVMQIQSLDPLLAEIYPDSADESSSGAAQDLEIEAWPAFRARVEALIEQMIVDAFGQHHEESGLEFLDKLQPTLVGYKGRFKGRVRAWAFEQVAELHEWTLSELERLESERDGRERFSREVAKRQAELTIGLFHSDLRRKAAWIDLANLCSRLWQHRSIIEYRTQALAALDIRCRQVAETVEPPDLDHWEEDGETLQDHWEATEHLRSWVRDRLNSLRTKLGPGETLYTEDIWGDVPRKLLTGDQQLELAASPWLEKTALAYRLAEPTLEEHIRAQLNASPEGEPKRGT